MVLFLALAALLSLSQSRRASREVISFFAQNADRSSHGLLWQRFEINDWVGRPSQSGVSRSLHFSSSQDAFMKGDFFNCRLAALFEIDRARLVRLGVASDDGSLLFLDGRRLIDNLGYHPMISKTTQARLSPGVHSLELLYHQERGGAELKLILPPGSAAGLRPLGPGIDPGQLWRLNRRVEWWGNRALILGLLAAGLAAALLLPFAWGTALADSLQRNWPQFLLSVGFGVVMFWGANQNPGLDGDAAHFGITAFEWHYKAKLLHYWSSYTSQQMMIWPVYLLQQILPLSMGLMRCFTISLNLLGLLGLGLAARQLFGRKASLWLMLLLGSSVWFLFFGRYFVEIHTFMIFSLGGFFWCAAASRRRWWLAGLGPVFLAAGIYAHGLMAACPLALGVFFLAAAGPGLFRDRRFWLGVAVMGLLALPWLVTYLGGGMRDSGSQLSPADWSRMGWLLLSDILPNMISGRYLAMFNSGQAVSPWPPVAPLVVLAALLVGPWLKLEPRSHFRVLRGLCFFVLTLFVVVLVKVPLKQGLDLRYFQSLMLGIFLLAGLILALWAKRSGMGGTLAKALCLALVLSGLYGYIGGCYLPFARSGGLCARVPHMDSSSARKMDMRGLYDFLAAQHRPVVFPYHDRRSLEFHDLEDLSGRKGLVVHETNQPGGLLIRLKGVPGGKKSAGCPGYLNSRPPSGWRPLALPGRLAFQYQVYILPPAKDGAK